MINDIDIMLMIIIGIPIELISNGSRNSPSPVIDINAPGNTAELKLRIITMNPIIKMGQTIELFGLNYFDELLTIQNWGNKTNTVAKVNSELSKVQQSVTNASTELRKDFNL